MTVGPLVIGLGLALLVRVDAEASYLTQVLPAMVVFGLGVAINVAPLTATALAAAPAELAGVASAVNNDVARIGGLIAVAVLPALAGITGATFGQPAALLDGFHSAVLISAAACALGGVLAGFTIRNPIVARVPLDRSRHCALEATPLRPDVATAVR
jgi:hypothetical protein